MIALVFSLLGGGKMLAVLLNFGAEIVLKTYAFILYLASEYWGRWVLFACVVVAALLYGRLHYIGEGRETEARYRAVLIDKAMSERCQTLKKKTKTEWTMPKGWPGG